MPESDSSGSLSVPKTSELTVSRSLSAATISAASSVPSSKTSASPLPCSGHRPQQIKSAHGMARDFSPLPKVICPSAVMPASSA